MIICGDIENRREIGHREDQGVFSIMDGSELIQGTESIWEYYPSRVIQSRRKKK